MAILVGGDENIKPCDRCSALTTFERDNETQPPEGQVCDLCDRWVCNDCVDWEACGFYGHDYVCVDCSKKDLTK